MGEPIRTDQHSGCRLWIDACGCWLIWFRQELVIGNGAADRTQPPRLRLLGELLASHARWQRRGDESLVPQGEVWINGVRIGEEQRLRPGDNIRLGDEVELRYQRPSPLSRSTVLAFSGSRRSAEGIDGVVLLTGHCLIGPAGQSHVVCRALDETLVLFESSGALCWRVHGSDQPAQSVQHGEVFGNAGVRIRAEGV